MFDLDRAHDNALKLLKSIDADGAELHVNARDVASTRFSGNAITQNMDEQSLSLRLRVIKDGRVGIATTNSFGADALDQCVARALAAAQHASPDPTLLPLIDQQPEYQSVDAFDPECAACDPKARAEMVGAGVKRCLDAGFEAAGLMSTGTSTGLYANSKGVVASHRATRASMNFSAFADEGSVEGNGQGVSNRIAGLDSDAICAAAVEKANKGRNPQPIQPGKYTVVLEQAALSDLMLFLNWLGFNTQTHIEGRSGLAGKIGEHVFSDKLSLRADPFDPRQQDCSFDGEGFPTQAFDLIKNGTLAGLPQDRRTASEMDANNLGYANPQPDPNGPMARSLVVAGGDTSLADMIASTERGLLVSQFHYTNAVDPMALSITGMTRAGLFLIEEGKVKHALTNLRFTESLLRAFNNIEAVGNDARLCAGGLFGGGMVLPSMKIRDFTFSSTTGF